MGKGSKQTFLQRRHADGQQVCKKVVNVTNHWGNANQAHNETSSHICWDDYYLKRKKINVGENVEKMGPLCTVGGNIKWCSSYESSMESPQKIKNRTAI